MVKGDDLHLNRIGAIHQELLCGLCEPRPPSLKAKPMAGRSVRDRNVVSDEDITNANNRYEARRYREPNG